VLAPLSWIKSWYILGMISAGAMVIFLITISSIIYFGYQFKE